jgi:hypothetical protein
VAADNTCVCNKPLLHTEVANAHIDAVAILLTHNSPRSKLLKAAATAGNCVTASIGHTHWCGVHLKRVSHLLLAVDAHFIKGAAEAALSLQPACWRQMHALKLWCGKYESYRTNSPDVVGSMLQEPHIAYKLPGMTLTPLVPSAC